MEGLLLVITALAVACVSNVQASKSSLVKQLMMDYNCSVSHDGSTTMTHELNILKFHLCPTYQHFIVKAQLQMTWEDDRLTWDAEEWGIDILWLRYDEINVPDVTVLNGDSQLKLEQHCPFNLALVYSNGTIVWSPFVSFTTVCDYNFKNFPWAKQSCTMQFASYTRDIEAGRPEVGPGLERLQRNKHEILSKSVEEVEKPLACCPDVTQKSLEYTIVFKNTADYIDSQRRLDTPEGRCCHQDDDENDVN